MHYTIIVCCVFLLIFVLNNLVCCDSPTQVKIARSSIIMDLIEDIFIGFDDLIWRWRLLFYLISITCIAYSSKHAIRWIQMRYGITPLHSSHAEFGQPEAAAIQSTSYATSKIEVPYARYPTEGAAENQTIQALLNLDSPGLGLGHKLDEWLMGEDLEIAYLEKLIKKAEGFAKEYGALKKKSKANYEVTPATAFSQAYNFKKNRYINVYPFDHSRVKLSGPPEKDFVNASLIPGYDGKRKFIACQAPKNETIPDFWRMVWEYNIVIIIMLCKLVEGGKEKCACYYEPGAHGDYIVSEESQRRIGGILIRFLSIALTSKLTEKRNVHLYQYCDWPDHGVPKNTSTVLYIRQIMLRTMQRMKSQSPVIVHCSAGAGRSGTFIAMDILFDQLEKEERVNVPQTTSLLRTYRTEMIQTQAQYEFVYRLLVGHYLYPKTDYSEKSFLDFLKTKKSDNVMYKEYRRFQHVELMAQAREDSAKDNKASRMRFSKASKKSTIEPPDLILTELEAPFFPCTVSVSSLPGFDTNDKESFWKAIVYANISCIIALDEQTIKEKDLTGNDKKKYGYDSITVQVKGVSKRTEGYVERDLEVHFEGDTLKLKSFYVPTNKDLYTPLPKNLIRHLDSRVQDLMKSTENMKCLVCCKDGHIKSGIFILLLSMLKRLEVTKRVDLFRGVKDLKEGLVEVVNTFEGYQSLYKYMKNCVETTGTNPSTSSWTLNKSMYN